MKRIALVPIALYRRWLSPALSARCRYEPSCSRYAEEAIQRFGLLKGSMLAIWRLLRCNPFSNGGFDPVRDHFTFRVGPIDPAVYHDEVKP